MITLIEASHRLIHFDFLRHLYILIFDENKCIIVVVVKMQKDDYMANDLHKGHRERVREEFFERGIPLNMPPHKVLEMLLFYCVQRTDTNELAHQMLERYSCLSDVLNAPREELEKFKGITSPGAMLLKMIIPVASYCEAEKAVGNFEFYGDDKAGKYLQSKFYGLEKEKIGVLYLNSLYRNLGFEFVSEGDASQTTVPISQIAKSALNKNASMIIIAHNHPSSYAIPSDEDINATIRIRDALKGIGIKLYDHIIVSDNDHVSLKQSGEYQKIFSE